MSRNPKRPKAEEPEVNARTWRPRPRQFPLGMTRTYMGVGQHDVRPALVALYYQEDWHGIDRIVEGGLDYLITGPANLVHGLSRAQLIGVAIYGLKTLLYPYKRSRQYPGEKDANASALGIAQKRFRVLSTRMVKRYRQWLYEGASSFLVASANAENPIGQREHEASPWKPDNLLRPIHRKRSPVVVLSDAEVACRPSQPGLLKWKLGNSRPPTFSSERPRVVGPRLLDDPDAIAVSEAIDIELAA